MDIVHVQLTVLSQMILLVDLTLFVK